MPDLDKLQEMVQRVVTDAFESHLPGLRYDLVRRIVQELQSSVTAAPGSSPSELLNRAIASLQESNSQAEILAGLIEAASKFAPRTALFVLRGASAVGWQARGFRDQESFRNFTVDAGQGMVARAAQTLKIVSGSCAEFDARFPGIWGAPSDNAASVFPLVVRDKAVALIYADRGAEPRATMESAAVELLVRSAGTWLEVIALRRSAAVTTGRTAEHSPSRTEAAPRAVVEPAPVAAMAAAASAVGTAAPATAVAEMPPAVLSPEEEEIHNKARRFAKLLVDEIKLYNQAKVTEGRQNNDLYERLKEDIDKSRSTYEKRYGRTAAGKADYFTQELVRILADNNPALLGSSFPR